MPSGRFATGTGSPGRDAGLHRRGDPPLPEREAPPQAGGLGRGGDSVLYEVTV
jgi:hypothetical protein